MQRRWVVVFFALLLLVQTFLFFRHGNHFFQGDAIFWLNHRARTVSDYLREFVQLNPSGWYRPLANELIESILYPFAGLHPIPYRIPLYIIFIAITISVYVLGMVLTRRHLTAAIAAFFFTIHTVNSYTTYDVGFTPELLYTFFYIGAVLAFLRYLENHSKKAYYISFACFLASLMSKEAAVTLPVMLLLIFILFRPTSQRFQERMIQGLRSILPHFVILIAYLVFVIVYLRIAGISLATLLNPPASSGGEYILSFDSALSRNADLALSWAFNIPSGWWGQWLPLSPGTVIYLELLRGVVFALSALLLFKPERRLIVFGSAWFWITVLPALPLVNHFFPYYLFLPIVGLSLVIGIVFVWLYDTLSRIRLSIAAATIVILLASLLYINEISIRSNIQNNRLLGGSALLASNTLNDLKSFYPKLSPKTTLYFEDSNEPLVWEHDWGGLIKMAYGIDTISALYQSQGHALPPDVHSVLVFEVQDMHLVEKNLDSIAKHTIFMNIRDSKLKLELSIDKALAGNKYVIRITPLINVIARIAYTINDGPPEIFNTWLDAEGKASFDVASYSRKGVFRFIAFNVSGMATWVRTQETLTIR